MITLISKHGLLSFYRRKLSFLVCLVDTTLIFCIKLKKRYQRELSYDYFGSDDCASIYNFLVNYNKLKIFLLSFTKSIEKTRL